LTVSCFGKRCFDDINDQSLVYIMFWQTML
jgi:hypothetical protein